MILGNQKGKRQRLRWEDCIKNDFADFFKFKQEFKLT